MNFHSKIYYFIIKYFIKLISKYIIIIIKNLKSYEFITLNKSKYINNWEESQRVIILNLLI